MFIEEHFDLDLSPFSSASPAKENTVKTEEPFSVSFWRSLDWGELPINGSNKNGTDG